MANTSYLAPNRDADCSDSFVVVPRSPEVAAARCISLYQVDIDRSQFCV